MKFELTPGIIESIIFAMENQDNLPLFDTKGLEILYEEDSKIKDNDEGRLIAIPEWTSRDGFSLMEGFADTVRNPLVREELRAVLRSGRGVFRQFKDTIRIHTEIENNWYRYKEREMQKRVYDWYNEQREYWGLEPLVFELEDDPDTEELVKSDFDFARCAPEEGFEIAKWDKKLFQEVFPAQGTEENELWYALCRKGFPSPAEDQYSPVIVVRTSDNENIGFLWALEAELPGLSGTSRVARVVQMGIEKQFRAMGIASALLRMYRSQAAKKGITRIFVDVPGQADFLGRFLQQEGFVQQSAIWELAI